MGVMISMRACYGLGCVFVMMVFDIRNRVVCGYCFGWTGDMLKQVWIVTSADELSDFFECGSFRPQVGELSFFHTTYGITAQEAKP